MNPHLPELQNLDSNFAGHVATRWQSDALGTPVERLVWARPQSSHFRIEALSIGRQIVIMGDLGDAVFQFSGPTSFEAFASSNPDYLLTKLRDFSGHSSAGRHWDRAAALRWLADWRAEETANNPERASELAEAQKNLPEAPEACVDSQYNWLKFLEDGGGDALFRGDPSEWPCNMGMVIHPVFLMILEGLKRALAQLEARRRDAETKLNAAIRAANARAVALQLEVDEKEWRADPENPAAAPTLVLTYRAGSDLSSEQVLDIESELYELFEPGIRNCITICVRRKQVELPFGP